MIIVKIKLFFDTILNDITNHEWNETESIYGHNNICLFRIKKNIFLNLQSALSFVTNVDPTEDSLKKKKSEKSKKYPSPNSNRRRTVRSSLLEPLLPHFLPGSPPTEKIL